MKVGVAVPSFDYVPMDFLTCLFGLFSSMKDDEAQTILINTRTSLIQQSRFIMVETALVNEVDKMLFIDSDMMFPSHALKKLLAWDKPFIGATYQRKRDPWGYLGYNLDNTKIDSTEKAGIEKVSLMPLGFTLVDMEVFSKVDRPWFCVGFDLQRNEWFSEDYGFCTGVRQAGYDVWCDHDLSKELGHIGQMVYGAWTYK